MDPSDLNDFRYRQIHLDFHTSEHIEDVGADFDPQDFVETLREGQVDSVTLFARCHHGWCYYPTNVGKPHPHLARPDLLGEMIAACHAADIATPIYLTAQWDELTAREHPEWRVMQAENRAANYPGTEPSAMNQLTPTWHTLCLNHQGYADYLIALAQEVAVRYAPPALFMDIFGSWECTCNACLESMRTAGRDPSDPADRRSNDRDVLMRFFKRFSSTLNREFPDLRIFFNSGHIPKGQRERYSYYGHLELESLPTGGWGYDHFPATARYADGLGLPFLGMTGRFHTHWGEFGGYKRPEALIFECCQMVALGARCSVGDQLHPRGGIERATYRLIQPAYQRVKALEPFARDAVYQCDVAVISVESQTATLGGHLGHRADPSDTAAARMLLEMQIPFDVVETDANLGAYRLVILPDDIRLDAALAKRLADFADQGGAILATGRSGLDPQGGEMLLDIGGRLAAAPVEFDPCYLRTVGTLDPDLVDTSIVMYDRPVAVEATDADVLGVIRPSYFNRSWDRFCSHLHTPEDLRAADIGPALMQKGRVAYCAFPLFRMYGASGQVLYKYLVRGLIERIAPGRLMGTDLPSAARMSLMTQRAQNRQVLHLLYAPTQTRGSGLAFNDGRTRAIEIIEDAPELQNARAWIHSSRAPARVTCAYSGEDLPWEHDEQAARLQIVFPSLHIHGAAVISLGDA